MKQGEATRRKPGDGLRRESRRRFERDQKKVRGEKPENGSSRETRRRFKKTWLMRETKRGFDERK